MRALFAGELAMTTTFIHEIRAYELLEQVGLALKPWGVVREAADAESATSNSVSSSGGKPPLSLWRQT